MKQFFTNRRGFIAGAAAVLATAAAVLRPAFASSKDNPKMTQVRMRKWEGTNEECEAYIYDPSKGDLNIADQDNPIPPGVAFEDLPDNWICPICGDPKGDFVPIDEWVVVSLPNKEV
jgi:rubredoxin